MRYGSGQYDQRITIFQPLCTRNSSGDAVKYWSAADLITDHLARTAAESATGTEDLAGMQAVLAAIPWSTTTLFARRREREAVEAFDGNKETVTQTIEFIVRYRTDLDQNTRITCNGADLDIKSIQVLGRKENLKLLAEART